jgi:hypothetical protein
MLESIQESDPWEDLEVYRQRYDIEDRLADVRRLEQSLSRRQAKAMSLLRETEVLQSRLAEAASELEVVQAEIAGSRQAGGLLIQEILDRVRVEQGEAWSPVAVRGFRIWEIRDASILGFQLKWSSSSMVARCLRQVVGDDIPHSESQCGPPACGIYAAKTLDPFAYGVTGCLHDGWAIGVVALSGKVIEHEHGYRGAHGSVVAIATRLDRRWLVTAIPEHVRSFFEDPERTVSSLGRTGFPRQSAARQFLNTWKEKEQLWTSDVS